MEIPIIVVDELNETLANAYYPDIEVLKLNYDDLTLDNLFSHFDVFFLSEYWDLKTFQKQAKPMIEKWNKIPRIVHCPHGFSDKSYYLNNCVQEDIVLIYGKRMLRMFQQLGILDQLKSYVITGNYRYAYYKKHKAYYQKIIDNEIRPKFSKDQRTILYAPTWQDSFQASTFFDACSPLINKLPDSYNMLVKLHPSLQRHDIAKYYQILNEYENRENVCFICEFPPIYPLLEMADIYIGDTSSIGYDFLALNKPMFFLNPFKEDPKKIQRVSLYQCGTNIFPDEYEKIYPIIEEALAKDKDKYAEIRQEIYLDTFGEQIPVEKIRKEIKEAYNRNRNV